MLESELNTGVSGFSGKPVPHIPVLLGGRAGNYINSGLARVRDTRSSAQAWLGTEEDAGEVVCPGRSLIHVRRVGRQGKKE